MQKNHTPIGSEGASLSRRNFITIAAASTAATLPAVAFAEANGKTSRLPQLPERPIDIIERHALVISNALKNYADGKFYVSVYPQQGDCSPIALKSIAADMRKLTLEAQLSECIRNLRGVLVAMHEGAKIAVTQDWAINGGDGVYMFRVQYQSEGGDA